ncbi:MAG: hypothetical protein UU73_C0002G0139 [Candidatus Daviesbacteria bacterium GW2011_GWA1_41_61]|uniref:YdbS-like PH domain-containing protein n=1 Tax=Candidatus Daviesbacteria bacterium GW2011_GWA2_40_9 TaxID=1618424 RepID=A0A0G0U0X2_9BACT|nr:MAG: hypothetical protein UU26_C0032G0013 [Candidatus Daviesbacteria bacterium GW2011_GWC1_40_9]KKR82733.1 MAG: hypothetical protein UU29_C0009G0004 [Candidatus Daviesbacteria bacterium GW2011_GWA2_40_9]KKR93799.1 MAG: hypothetical protein UU44_C0001G0139 [Candidatus Daviesbacteria bacterium GW2011_GWB1_41_15]KKS15265.1 MAG: hypothetical protein UU73_C0002G0139 [Candidatus Daviesbacteria bacterium GW2011_GWA1_41_61]
MGKLHYREAPSEKEKKSFAKFLAEDEELVLATGLGKAYLRSQFIIAIALPGIIFILAGLGFAYLLKLELVWGLVLGLLGDCSLATLKTLHLYHANRYILTTRRVLVKKGVFTVQLHSALYDKITHIEVDQPFFDKILMHYGTIVIDTAGMNKVEIILKYIDYPIEFKNLLERLINREREQYGYRGGPIVTVEGEVVD